jgi:Ca2+-binding EF-hand superfamily protein
MEFTEEQISVLKNAFDSSDIDGDGLISRADLKATSGLSSDEEVGALFEAMK